MITFHASYQLSIIIIFRQEYRNINRQIDITGSRDADSTCSAWSSS
jgi:hypothetical protein